MKEQPASKIKLGYMYHFGDRVGFDGVWRTISVVFNENSLKNVWGLRRVMTCSEDELIGTETTVYEQEIIASCKRVIFTDL